VSRARYPPIFGRVSARKLWRLTRVYWASPAARKGGLLLVLAVGPELGTVYGNVFIAGAQRRIVDAVQDKQMPAFCTGMGSFLRIAVGFVLVSAYRIYVRQWLEMRWRESVTTHYLERWIGPQAYCQGELHSSEADNPDQLISEDIRNYVASTLGLARSLLAAGATLYSFSGLLWNLSADWPLQWRGAPVCVPGLMMWIAFVYAVVASAWASRSFGVIFVFETHKAVDSFVNSDWQFGGQATAAAQAGGKGAAVAGAASVSPGVWM
jgi:vitamin B12/bleomycin/antimicrobial peptide transport system ATP-binding/permease protein